MAEVVLRITELGNGIALNMENHQGEPLTMKEVNETLAGRAALHAMESILVALKEHARSIQHISDVDLTRQNAPSSGTVQ